MVLLVVAAAAAAVVVVVVVVVPLYITRKDTSLQMHMYPYALTHMYSVICLYTCTYPLYIHGLYPEK